jgi:WD40 repeat protein
MDLKKAMVLMNYQNRNVQNNFHSLDIDEKNCLFAVSCLKSCDIYIFGIKSGSLFRTLKGHFEPIMEIFFIESQSELLSISDEKYLRLWSIRRNTLKKPLNSSCYELSSEIIDSFFLKKQLEIGVFLSSGELVFIKVKSFSLKRKVSLYTMKYSVVDYSVMKSGLLENNFLYHDRIPIIIGHEQNFVQYLSDENCFRLICNVPLDPLCDNTTKYLSSSEKITKVHRKFSAKSGQLFILRNSSILTLFS